MIDMRKSPIKMLSISQRSRIFICRVLLMQSCVVVMMSQHS
nr:MAG TPA: ABC transporter [Caudoviricetes sp.]